MLVESLVVSSHEFSCSFFYLFFLPCFKNTKFITTLLCFSLLCFHLILLIHYFLLFFDSLKYWRTLNTHENQPVKPSITSWPCGFDPFSHHAITEVSRKLKYALLTHDFKPHTFHAQFSPDQILESLSGMETVWFYIFFNFSSLFQGTDFGIKKTRIAEIYNWFWASALKNRNQVPSNVSCFHGRIEWTTNSFFQGCLLWKKISFLQIKVEIKYHHQDSAIKKSKNQFRLAF